MSSSLTITIAGQDSETFKAEIQKLAHSQGMSMSEFVVLCISEYLRK